MLRREQPSKGRARCKTILRLSDLAQVPEEIDTEEAAATLFDALGLSFALPLLSLLPKEWRRQKARPLDLACSKYAHALLALSSPLTAAGIWTMLFKAKARYQGGPHRECVVLMGACDCGSSINISFAVWI
jgi:hypothetical protein